MPEHVSLLSVAAAHPAVRLALVDPKMPQMHGGLRLLDLARNHPLIPVVVVSAPSFPNVVRRIMSIATVHAFVPRAQVATACIARSTLP
jgi:CheY-like chemotaxis protein